MNFMDLPAFMRTLEDPVPPADLEIALRALWFDGKGRDDSAMRAACFDDNHMCKRVRAYLFRKRGDEHAARLWYWKCGMRDWEGSLESEWEDIVQSILSEPPVKNAYT